MAGGLWYMTPENRLERVHPFHVMKALRMHGPLGKARPVPLWIERAIEVLLRIRGYLAEKERGGGTVEALVAFAAVAVFVAIVLVPLWATLVDGLGSVARALSEGR